MSDAELSAKGRCFLDSNVIVYAMAPSDPFKFKAARDILGTAVESRRGVISAQVLGETFVTLTQKVSNPLSREAALANLKALSCLRVVPLTGDLVFRAIELQGEHQLSYWDALIVAAAEGAGCATLWSEDLSDGRVYGAVTVRNPFRR